jgi:phosphoglycerate kinase
MRLRSVAEILPKTRVVLRMDLDLPMEGEQILDNQRLQKSIPTIKILLEKGCKIAIVGHRGRPEGKDETLSLKPIYVELMTLLEPNGENLIESVFVEDVGDREKLDQALVVNQIVFLENLRFWKSEESNDPEFLKNLVEVCQFYVNDAFANSHRKHRSIMLYKSLPGFYGISFIEEAEKIGRLLDNPERPLTIILGGAKEDKLEYLPELEKMADHILIGGKLPNLPRPPKTSEGGKIFFAKLRPDGLDLSEDDINKFKEIISSSKTIVWAGAMGKYEDSNCKGGTEEIAKAIADNDGYKIIAGGDTGASIINLGLKDRIDFICSGGGVTLEYLTKGKLPAWE